MEKCEDIHSFDPEDSGSPLIPSIAGIGFRIINLHIQAIWRAFFGQKLRGDGEKV